MTKSTIALLAVILLSIPPMRAQAEERKFVISFQAESGYLLLQTTISGKQAVLILDTGSPVSFSNGHILLLRAKDGVISFRFDDRNPLSVQYYPPDRIAYDGILGNDLLKQFRSVTVDYKTHTVTLSY